MTIPETQAHLRKCFENNNWFGLKEEQVIFLDQSTVPAVVNSKGDADFNPETGEMNQKPYGHGECHLLMHKSGLAKKLKEDGFKWIIFFNDTNPLAFRFLPSYLGITKERNWETTYICVKRKPGEAIGAICEVQRSDGSTIITNVEYNVLGKLSLTHPEPVDQEGYSKLPGNINFIIISLETYATNLARHGGFVPEFINPKLEADGVTLKGPTRLETLISEYPYLLENSNRVGAISIEKLMAFSCAKNEFELARQRQAKNLTIETCGSCQFEYYDHNRILLEKLGAVVGTERLHPTFEGIKYEVGPSIILHPSFACTFRDLESTVQLPVTISSRSFLEIQGKVLLKDFQLDGSVKIINKKHHVLTLEGKRIKEQNYITFSPVPVEQSIDYDDQIRGFVTQNREKIIEVIPDI